jgi:zinc transporter 1/2/3
MNCPSRNDDDVLLHPDWNQNPPRFAADLTTCEDLNGRANARELRDAGSLKDVYDGFARYIVDARGAEVLEQLRMRLGEGVEGLHQGACNLQRMDIGPARY